MDAVRHPPAPPGRAPLPQRGTRHPPAQQAPQSIRQASQIDAALVGVKNVLAEPSIDLHQRDNET
ncbi:hypothetical protein AAGG49_22870, partial [Stenotrophomonas maltophilia]|uniref:hypothetical protein n=1 Tax=Stenotrophomonas maltophilia TaxID=40324 RepID=UPI00313F0275